MESKEAIEIMLSHGYKNTATVANGAGLFFLKKISDTLDLHGTVTLKTESVYLDIIGALDLGISIRSPQMALDSPILFEKTEESILIYINLLLYGVLKDKKEKVEKPLEERKSNFWNEIRRVAKEEGYEKEMCLEFYGYWTEKNGQGKLMEFEKERTFQVKPRLNTWLRNDKKWSKDFVDKKIEKQNKELEETGTKVIKKKDLF
jgi:hypothetical protein